MGAPDNETGYSRSVELLINDLAAEQAAVRLTVQSFLARLFAQRPDASPEAFHALRDSIIASVRAIPPDSEDPEGATLWKEMVEGRVTEMFSEMDEAIDWKSKAWRARKATRRQGA